MERALTLPSSLYGYLSARRGPAKSRHPVTTAAAVFGSTNLLSDPFSNKPQQQQVADCSDEEGWLTHYRLQPCICQAENDDSSKVNPGFSHFWQLQSVVRAAPVTCLPTYLAP